MNHGELTLLIKDTMSQAGVATTLFEALLIIARPYSVPGTGNYNRDISAGYLELLGFLEAYPSPRSPLADDIIVASANQLGERLKRFA